MVACGNITEKFLLLITSHLMDLLRQNHREHQPEDGSRITSTVNDGRHRTVVDTVHYGHSGLTCERREL